MNPTNYYRNNKQWSKYLGRIGIVTAVSQVKVSTSRLAVNCPYCLLIIDFEDQRKEFIGVAGENFKTGDKVECVLRKLDKAERHEIISYGIKVSKIM